MTDPLSPPSSWTERLTTLRVPDLVLSHYPRLLPPPGRSLADVERDLEKGAWFVRVRGSAAIYRLGGREFELRVRQQTSKTYPDRVLAVVLNIDEAEAVPRKVGRLLPDAVRLADIREDFPYDLTILEESLRRRMRDLRPGRGRGLGQREVQAHGWLQKEVRRQYGELGALMDLLEQRPRKPEEAIHTVVAGRGAAGRRRTVTLEAEDRIPEGFHRNGYVQVRMGGRLYNTRISAIRARIVEIHEPRDWTGERGNLVTLSTVPPFGLRQNAEALQAFLKGEIEGSWDDLARLLCRTSDLTLPESFHLPVETHAVQEPGVPRLNEEQRRAVDGAVSSPHAFLIQGPPGTGKTEVICETVRRLVDRGERVLLLAPAHVAVDEVLARVGGKPGVRPLRVTWSDDLVAPELRAYLPGSVGVELAHRLTSFHDPGRPTAWEDERAKVEERIHRLDALFALDRRHDEVIADLRAVSVFATQARQRLEGKQESARQELAELEQAERAGRAVLETAGNTAREAVSSADTALARIRPLLEEIGRAANTLATAAEEELRNRHTWQAAEAELNQWVLERGERLAILARELDTIHRQMAKAQSQAADAEQAIARLRPRLDAARQRWGARMAERMRLGEAADLRKDLETAERAHTYWTKNHELRAQDWGRLHAEHRVLTAAVPPDGLVNQVNIGRAETARTAPLRRAAVVRFAQALANGTAPAAEPALREEEWANLATAVSRAVRDILAERTQFLPPIAIPDGLAGLRGLFAQLERLRGLLIAKQEQGGALSEAVSRYEHDADRLRQARVWADAELERFGAESAAAQTRLAATRAELDAVNAERTRLRETLQVADPEREKVVLERRRHVLAHLPTLYERWWELAGRRTDDQLVNDVQEAVLRATNLVCATTKGIVGRGSDMLRHADYDTLIVDEASRVTESEFLIGAVRARRWVLVGDERQLPPHVDQDDEHFLHALAAIMRHARDESDTLESAVEDLAGLWTEDEELRVFRKESVLETARELHESGLWEGTFRTRLREAHQRFAPHGGKVGDLDAAFLTAMIRYLVQSLFERAVAAADDSMRQRLVWQRRMAAPLARLVNEPIYGGDYRTPEADGAVPPPLVTQNFPAPVVFVDTSRYPDSREKQSHHGFVNRREQDLIAQACEMYNSDLHGQGADRIKVSVLAFYRAQARELRERLTRMRLPKLEWDVIDVIDRIQGQQSDLVIVSFTRARPRRAHMGPGYGQWLLDARRLNVACSRARRALVLVGSADTLRRLGSAGTLTAQAKQARAFYDNMMELFRVDGDYHWKDRL
ncbi:AAA domain-containing protein [Nonomuraea sp. NPDC004297]